MILEHDWPESELRLLDRYVELLREGRYRSGAEAARVCHEKLKAMWRRRATRRRPVVERTATAVQIQFGIRKRRAHVSATYNRWQPPELRVVDQFVEALRAGRYATITAAATGCCRRLAELRAENPSIRASSVGRNERAVYQRLNARVVATGETSYAPWWNRDELRVATRYGRALAKGRYAELAVAAGECREELALLAQRRPGEFRTRPPLGIYNAVAAVAHRLGWSSQGRRMNPQEKRIIERHSRAYVRGKYRDSVEAARACYDELDAFYRSHRAFRPMTIGSVRTCVWRRYHEMGMPFARAKWTTEEDAVVRRYARALSEGRYRSSTTAVEECVRDLARLRSERHEMDPVRYRRTRARREREVRTRIDAFAARLDCPRPFVDWTEPETAILEQHARSVIEGRHDNAGVAARACYRDLVAYYRRLREGHGLKAVAGRSYRALLGKMHQRVRELGRRGPPNRRWSHQEKRLASRWLRWYDRPRGLRHVRPLMEAAEELKEGIEMKGGRRTLSACRGRLQVDRWHASGMA